MMPTQQPTRPRRWTLPRALAFLTVVALATATAPALWARLPFVSGTAVSGAVDKLDVVPGMAAGAKNVVNLVNRTDGKLRVMGQVQLARVPGPGAAPTNLANAYSRCQGCNSLAVAAQIALISKSAGTIAPQNVAVAQNWDCDGCVTMARAVQYVLQVDDPARPPPRVQQLVNEMNAAINDAQVNATSIEDANARVDAVLMDFQDLAMGLSDQRQETADPTTPGAPPPDQVGA